ncbi:MAG: DUF6580 family putative transport protein [Terriglobales bacterium]
MRLLPLDGYAVKSHNRTSRPEVTMLPYLFILFAFLFRFIPYHPLGFTPVAAALLFFGARGSRRRLWVPLVLMAVSDIVLTKFVYAYPFTWDHYVTFAWYAAILWLGTNLRENAKPFRVIAAALAGSVSFFLLSNFAVWASWPDLYPKTAAGLLTCYAVGLPYFRRAAAGDLLFTAIMFATPVILLALSRTFSRAGDGIAAA